MIISIQICPPLHNVAGVTYLGAMKGCYLNKKQKTKKPKTKKPKKKQNIVEI
jgi:hypothetical protein